MARGKKSLATTGLQDPNYATEFVINICYTDWSFEHGFPRKLKRSISCELESLIHSGPYSFGLHPIRTRLVPFDQRFSRWYPDSNILV
jgi:hypothetical protein